MTKLTNSTEPRIPAKPPAAIGSGWILIARDPARGRLKGAHYPFEHPTREHAYAEAIRLAESQGRDFEVFGRLAKVRAPEILQPVEPPKRRTISLPSRGKVSSNA